LVLDALGFPGLITSSEYDQWPRGRIVYERPVGRFLLYADRRLQQPDIIAALKRAFGLTAAAVVIRSDLHYREKAPISARSKATRWAVSSARLAIWRRSRGDPAPDSDRSAFKSLI
jgi:hypothetical protein